MKQSNRGHDSQRNIAAIGIGLAVYIIATIVSVTIGTIFIVNEYCSYERIKFVAILIQLVSVFSACITAGILSREHKEFCSAVTAVATYVLTLCISLLFFDRLGDNVLLGLIATILTYIVAIIAVKKKKSRSARRKNKRQPR